MAKKKPAVQNQEDLYICMYDVNEKRKNLLGGIKNSLIMQEEYEKIKELRQNKALIEKEIKKNLDEINKKYQELKKDLPNVKNIISYTEKEIEELDSQINILEEDNRKNLENIELEKNLKKKLKKSNSSLRNKKDSDMEQKKELKKNTVTKPKKVTKKVSKLDRIQNNLRVIEEKLKQI